MSATLTEVARRAGVSVATASRAFGEPGRLAAGTLERVLHAANEVGYQATQPPTATRTIGIVIPDVANPVYATLLKSIHAQAWHGRHRTVLYDTDEDPHREREQIQRASELDGMLLCSPRLPDDEVRLLVGDTASIGVNRDVPGLPCVVMDTDRGPRQAVEYLAALGHEHLAYAAGPEGSWADIRRSATVETACAQFGMRLTRLSHQAASIQGGRAASATAVASGATAVVAYNDLVALGLEAGMAEMGRACPDDVSIVGIDDIEMSSAVNPGLTTVRMPIERCGSLAVDLLLQALSGAEPPTVTTLDSQLIVRGSTAPPPRVRG
ncbi:LacI family DNA-binding transcriptional regulator [Microbacterium horticulturae]|uniref:LacI family DNA-binding transcriptional regulator n=1 Tax=Microbacterium horticulturae TaxID=3028316 RepID=A0ABY8C0D4_9MICO|nr:LacI family DNA-binding transcriptional regulator [Microbacterium sp. KACC 23027]WEG08797.1 LacI family DNA-binding transcriptional regulator [Microbacterium sp. KACC 23027]